MAGDAGDDDESDRDGIPLQNDAVQDEEEQSYHERFVNEIRKKDQLEQIESEKNQVNFDEDDDKFIISL